MNVFSDENLCHAIANKKTLRKTHKTGFVMHFKLCTFSSEYESKRFFQLHGQSGQVSNQKYRPIDAHLVEPKTVFALGTEKKHKTQVGEGAGGRVSSQGG